MVSSSAFCCWPFSPREELIFSVGHQLDSKWHLYLFLLFVCVMNQSLFFVFAALLFSPPVSIWILFCLSFASYILLKYSYHKLQFLLLWPNQRASFPPGFFLTLPSLGILITQSLFLSWDTHLWLCLLFVLEWLFVGVLQCPILRSLRSVSSGYSQFSCNWLSGLSSTPFASLQSLNKVLLAFILGGFFAAASS